MGVKIKGSEVVKALSVVLKKKYSEKELTEIVNAYVGIITQAMATGRLVHLPGLGSVQVGVSRPRASTGKGGYYYKRKEPVKLNPKITFNMAGRMSVRKSMLEMNHLKDVEGEPLQLVGKRWRS